MTSFADRIRFDSAVRAYRQRNYAKALQITRPLAETGDAKAQEFLGNMYANGDGLPVDFNLAFYWCERAAHNGRMNAQYLLSFLYKNGKGTEKNEELSLKWCRIAANQGHARALNDVGLHHLGLGTIDDIYSAEEYFIKSIESSATDCAASWNAMMNLASIYSNTSSDIYDPDGANSLYLAVLNVATNSDIRGYAQEKLLAFYENASHDERERVAKMAKSWITRYNS